MTRAALFVDDEQRILDGLRRGLRGLRHDWDLRFALGGEAALEALHPDLSVVVSDMRMPGLDGAAVLSAARERAPHAARLVLSGNSDRPAALRASQVAHRFVAKPCDAATLQALLPALSACVEASEQVAGFAAPAASAQTAASVHALLEGYAPLDDVAEVVVQDPGLTLVLLHAASSDFLAPATACTDVDAAVAHLGRLGVLDLVTATPLHTEGPGPRPAVSGGSPTVRALAGLAPLVAPGALVPTLQLWGLAPQLVAEVSTALARDAA